MSGLAKKLAPGEVLQVAALPWRRGEDGLEVMMITSRETRRWVVPKGWPMEDRTDPQAAAQEAYEEAGVQGEISAREIGYFRYDKRLKSGEMQPCLVMVYPLEVLIQLGAWPESHQRTRHWMSQEQAADVVAEVELADLIRGFRAPS